MRKEGPDYYIAACLSLQLFCGLMLSERYIVRIIGCEGPSMEPTIDSRDNLVLLDAFTVNFIRWPRHGEVICALNPFKPGYTVVKRVLFTEGEMAKFYCQNKKEYVEVEVPQGHIWIEGDNKENSNDSRHFGPISLGLVQGICRQRIFPFDKINRL